MNYFLLNDNWPADVSCVTYGEELYVIEYYN